MSFPNLVTVNPTEITEDYFGGYHRCCLTPPYFLDYASESLCNILGYTSNEIHTLFEDKYSLMIYKNDRKKFLHFLDELASKEQTLSLQYRMICKDGHMIYVNDTMTSRRLEDGRMYGFSVVATTTNTPLDYSTLPDTTQLIGPHGFLQCTCEKYPKVIHMNPQMMEYLGITESNSNWAKFFKENIFFMIPSNEWEVFEEFLEDASHSNGPIMINHQVHRSDDSIVTLTGWLSVIEDEMQNKTFTFIYMDKDNIPEAPAISKRETSYFNAIKNSYNIIFEINLINNTVECIHGKKTSDIGTFYDIHMTIESAKNFWINHHIIKQDRELMREFLDRITTPSEEWNESHVLQTEFRLKWNDYLTHHFLGVAIQLDLTTVLFCCRDISHLKYPNTQTKEYVAIDRTQKWLDYFLLNNRKNQSTPLGMFAFEESKVDKTSSLVYISASLCKHLKINRNDYLSYISGEFSLKECLNKLGISSEDLERLKRSESVQCSIQSSDALFTRQVILTSDPPLDAKNEVLYQVFIYENIPKTFQNVPKKEPKVEQKKGPKIFARTFGHFDLFVDGLPVSFSNNKEKELMALLIDRNGGTLSSNEAINYLWEGEVITEQLSSKYRKLAMKLKNTLKKYGIEKILIVNHGIRSVDTSLIECDYYELLAGNKKYMNSFHNSYMVDYSWAEETLGTLWDYS